MATVLVKEGDGHTVTVAWKDGMGNSITPDAVQFRVDCLTTVQEALDWTDATPAANMTIEIPGSANAIKLDANETENKQVTIQANAGQSNQRTVIGVYVVQNNAFVT
jgi:hypothetical protein